jgi:hypothetical protein
LMASVNAQGASASARLVSSAAKFVTACACASFCLRSSSARLGASTRSPFQRNE